MTLIRLEVAALGNPAGPFSFEDEEWDRPWQERERRSIDVESSRPIVEVLDEAMTAFAVDRSGLGAPSFIAFYDPADPYASPHLTTTLTLVDDSGRARWNVHFSEATYDELLTSSEAGAFTADPLRPYLVLLHPMGNGMSVPWPAVVAGWVVFVKAMGFLADAGGAASTSARVVQRIKELTGRAEPVIEVIDRHFADWSERGAAPYDLIAFLKSRTWTTEDLSRLLGCAPAEAEAILWSHGFAYDQEQGRWHARHDSSARVLGDIADVVAHFELDVWENKDRLILRMRAIVLEMLDAEARALDWTVRPDEQPQ